jgi:hypothetical protein
MKLTLPVRHYYIAGQEEMNPKYRKSGGHIEDMETHEPRQDGGLGKKGF